MKGRSSGVISIRVSDSVYTTLQELAGKKGLTVSAFIKEKVEGLVVKVGNHSVNNNVNTIPIYNPAIHKAGDTVRIFKGKREVIVTIPELDAEGNSIPDTT